jgi:hypothetical protein
VVPAREAAGGYACFFLSFQLSVREVFRGAVHAEVLVFGS